MIKEGTPAPSALFETLHKLATDPSSKWYERGSWTRLTDPGFPPIIVAGTSRRGEDFFPLGSVIPVGLIPLICLSIGYIIMIRYSNFSTELEEDKSIEELNAEAEAKTGSGPSAIEAKEPVESKN